MALADILERIAADARTEADTIVREAEAAAEATLAQAHAEAETTAEEIARASAATASSEAETVTAAARLAARDRALAARRELVERVLRDSVDALVGLSDDAYAAFLARGVVAAARGGERVLIAPADAVRLAGRLHAALRQLAGEAGNGLDLTFGEEPADGIEHGVLLEGHRVRIEVSPASALAARREELTMLASKTLFPEGE